MKPSRERKEKRENGGGKTPNPLGTSSPSRRETHKYQTRTLGLLMLQVLFIQLSSSSSSPAGFFRRQNTIFFFKKNLPSPPAPHQPSSSWVQQGILSFRFKKKHDFLHKMLLLFLVHLQV